jgi:hypothetical protein
MPGTLKNKPTQGNAMTNNTMTDHIGHEKNSTINNSTTSTVLLWLSIAAIAATGIIHLIESPDNLSEVPYKGVLFILNGIGALLAAFLLARADRRGWWLGLAVAASAALGYVLSRTVGLPLLPAEPDAWFEPLGIASLLIEVAFIALAATWHAQRPATEQATAEAKRG